MAEDNEGKNGLAGPHHVLTLFQQAFLLLAELFGADTLLLERVVEFGGRIWGIRSHGFADERDEPEEKDGQDRGNEDQCSDEFHTDIIKQRILSGKSISIIFAGVRNFMLHVLGDVVIIPAS